MSKDTYTPYSYQDLLNESLADLKERNLPNRTDLTYLDVLGINRGAAYSVATNPPVYQKLKEEKGTEFADKMAEQGRLYQPRVDLYSRPALDYDELLSLYDPDLLAKQQEYDKDPVRYSSQYGAASRGGTELMSRPASVGEEKARRLATQGFNPFEELKFENFGDRLNFRTDIGLNPRNLTIEQVESVGKKYNLEGDYRYVDPRNPYEGILFKPEGQEEYQLINTPFITEEDIGKLVLNEVPALAGDIFLMLYGPKGANKVLEKLGAPVRVPELMGKYGVSGNLATKAGKIAGLSGLSAFGAAGGDMIRLMLGTAKGSHDLSLMEILEESAMTGAFSFLGTGAVTTAVEAIPFLWKAITGKLIPTRWYEFADEILKQKQTAEKGGKLQSPFFYGSEESVININNQIDELADLIAEDLPKYNPTISSALGTIEAADLEFLFLKHAKNEDLLELYGQMKGENQEIIRVLLNRIGEKVGPKIGAQVTADDLAPEIQAIVSANINRTIDEGYLAIDSLLNKIGPVSDDIADTGQVLLNKVDDPRASELFKRTQTRIQELRQTYVDNSYENFNTALSNPAYADTLTGAGFIRKPAREWNNVTKKQTNELFNFGGSKEAKELFQELLGRDGGRTIRRLQGMNPKTGKFADGETIGFTIKELNDARAVLNDFASQVDNKIARKLASDLELGIGQQMNRLVDEAAAKKSGFEVGTKELKNWRSENNFGGDIERAWLEMKEAIELSNTQVLRTIAETESPEKTVQFILNTSTKGSKVNTQMSNFMKILKDEGADEIQAIQQGLGRHIRQTVLADDGKSAFQMAREYKNFMRDHEGTLKAVFGEDFTKKFSGRTGLDRLIKKLQKDEIDIKRIQARFGLSDISEGQGLADIMKTVINQGKRGDRSGTILRDINYLMDVVKDNPELKLQISQVVKNELTEEFLKVVPGTGGMKQLDTEALNRLLNEGWGTPGVSADVLSFEEFFKPLLGEQADQYLKFLKLVNEMSQREIGRAPSKEAVRTLNLLRQEETSPIKGAQIFMRMFIKPLTQAGRRASAFRNRVNQNAADLMGKMMIEQDFMEKMLRAQERQVNTQQWLRILSSYYWTSSQDTANIIKYYDPESAELTLPEETEMSAEALLEMFAENPASAPLFTGAQ